MTSCPPGRDRIRELLDAVLVDQRDETNLHTLAAHAHSSSFHFSRQISRVAGEAPVAMRRRVLLERAAWELQRGRTVTDAAFGAGYDSVEGFSRAFSRAFGCVPSAMSGRTERGHWLPAPNGIHFHSPTVLYVDVGQEISAGDVVALMIRHDLDDTDAVLAAAESVPEAEYRRERMPGHRVLEWAGDETSLADVLRHLALDKLPWLASKEGEDAPELREADDVPVLRRQLARWMLAQSGADVSHLDPDPIMWHRRASGGTS